MFYEKELRFLCDTLKKLHIDVKFSSLENVYKNMFDDTFNKIFDERIGYSTAFGELYGNIERYKMYKFTDSLKFSFIFFILPETKPEEVMIIGPFLSEIVTKRQILEIGEKYGISPSRQNILAEYYRALTVLGETSHLFLVIETFAEHIWGTSTGFSVVDINRELVSKDFVLSENRSEEDTESLLANMDIMQKRYDFENELIRAVEQGQEYKAARILENIGAMAFDRRLSDPVRNTKNYCIIMNTLLRKAAESGGAHPLYINDVSSEFAAKIERLQSVSGAGDLMSEMFTGYCRLVRKYSMKNFSPIVKKTVTIIRQDLSANLTLSSLAKSQNISSGYLASVFKRDTGKTVNRFILDERMQLAMRLLTTTSLQVQTVALHCGIMDVQYFSKLFKRHTGKTPKEYRKASINT